MVWAWAGNLQASRKVSLDLELRSYNTAVALRGQNSDVGVLRAEWEALEADQALRSLPVCLGGVCSGVTLGATAVRCRSRASRFPSASRVGTRRGFGSRSPCRRPGLGRRTARARATVRCPLPADSSPDTTRQLPSKLRRLRAMTAPGTRGGAQGVAGGRRAHPRLPQFASRNTGSPSPEAASGNRRGRGYPPPHPLLRLRRSPGPLLSPRAR